MITEEKKRIIELASEAYAFAFRLNDFEPVAGKPCRDAFSTARSLLFEFCRCQSPDGDWYSPEVERSGLGARFVHEEIDNRVHDSYEYEVADLIRYFNETKVKTTNSNE